MSAAAPAWKVAGSGGVSVRVRLTPRSSRDCVDGLETTADGPAVKARVRAVPEDGAANAAVMRLVAGWLGVPVGSVALVSGGRSRVKSLRIDGDAGALIATLEAWRAGLAAMSKTDGEA